MGDVMKACMYASFDKKNDAREKTCALLRALYDDPHGLSRAQVNSLSHIPYHNMYLSCRFFSY